jgi:hypothetical protein
VLDAIEAGAAVAKYPRIALAMDAVSG